MTSEYKLVPPGKLIARPTQVRQEFSTEFLNELASSVKKDGILAPLLVRESDKDGKLEIIAGEQRWRAARIAKLKKVPVVVVDVDDHRSVELAYIENEMRKDLSSIEREDAITIMWKSGHYKSYEKLGMSVGLGKERIGKLILSREDRTGVLATSTASTYIITETRGLDPETRRAIIEEENIPKTTQSLRQTVRLLKEAPEQARPELVKAIAKGDVNLEDAEEIATTVSSVIDDDAETGIAVRQLVKARKTSSEQEFKATTRQLKREKADTGTFTPIEEIVEGPVLLWNSYLESARQIRNDISILSPAKCSDWPVSQRQVLMMLLQEIHTHIESMLEVLDV